VSDLGLLYRSLTKCIHPFQATLFEAIIQEFKAI